MYSADNTEGKTGALEKDGSQGFNAWRRRNVVFLRVKPYGSGVKGSNLSFCGGQEIPDPADEKPTAVGTRPLFHDTFPGGE